MEEYVVWAGIVLNKIKEKLDWVSEKNKDRIPYTTDEKGYMNRSSTMRVLDSVRTGTAIRQCVKS